MADADRVFKIKDSNPELFFIITPVPTHSRFVVGTTTVTFTERDLRAKLANAGHTEEGIDSALQRARENPCERGGYVTVPVP